MKSHIGEQSHTDSF